MTTIKYKIVSTNPQAHQITVRFYTDWLPESQLVSAWMPDGITPKAYRTDYLLTLPHPAPQGADLDKYISAHCPVAWFELQQTLMQQGHDSSLNTLPIGEEKDVLIIES